MQLMLAKAELASFKNQYVNLNHWLASLTAEEQIMVLKGLASTSLMRNTFPNFSEFIDGMTSISAQIFDPITDPVEGVENELRMFFGENVPRDLADLLDEFRPEEARQPQVTDLGELAAAAPENVTAEAETATTVVYTFIAGNHSFQVRANDKPTFATRLVSKIQELRNSGLPADQIPGVFRDLSERFWGAVAESVYDEELARRQGTETATAREVRSFAAKNSTKG